MQDIETQLLNALNKNPACFLGMNNGQRVFVRYDSSSDVKEILILIDSYDIWAHVFHYDSYWYTTLVIFPIALNARDINDLFKNFWSRMKLANKDVNFLFWFPANDSHDSYQASYQNDSFDAAIRDLMNIINHYQAWHNGLDQGACNHDFQIKQIYEDIGKK